MFIVMYQPSLSAMATGPWVFGPFREYTEAAEFVLNNYEDGHDAQVLPVNTPALFPRAKEFLK